ncbi:MAG: glycosyltransferase [Sphingobacteriaceae bacterium]|nr:glycosyltransferase [Sphingobacteriaceae bacterium]
MLKLDALLWINLLTQAYWLLSFGYLLLFATLGYYWLRKEQDYAPLSPLPPLSLVIAIRNEAANLPALFQHLHQLSYPSLEVLLVDDHSEDESLQLLQQAVQDALVAGKDWRLLQATGQGKKAAISTALAVAKGEIIVTTDADCSFGTDWLERLTAPFTNDKIQLSAGPVMSAPLPEYVLNTFQQVDWASILLVTRLSFSIGSPFMCNAANMAYRKSAFEQVNGYHGNNHFLSGDDEFLLKKIISTYGKASAKYSHQPQLLVRTQPQKSWAEFLSQRARWASKWRSHDFKHVLVAAMPSFVLLLYLLSPFLLLLGKAGGLAFAGLWVMKIVSEYWVVAAVMRSFGIRFNLAQMIIASCMHPFYALATALTIGQKNWEWKGRKQASL